MSRLVRTESVTLTPDHARKAQEAPDIPGERPFKKRRKQLRADIDSRGGAEPDIAFPGTDLIEGPA